MRYKKIFTILLFWYININFIRYAESGCFGACFKCCKPDIKHTKRKFEYSDFFESNKNTLVSPAECDLAVLDLRSIDSDKFVVEKINECRVIHPKDVTILINKIKYKGEELPLYTNPLYREVYVYKGKFYKYVYVLSYFGDEHYYYQIFRRLNLYPLAKYSTHYEDPIDKLYFGNQLSTKERLKEVFSTHVIVINILGNTIPASFSRLGNQEKFILTSMVPSEYSTDVKFLSDGTRIIFNINGIDVELPRDYIYSAVFKNNDMLRVMISTNVYIKRLTYLLKENSAVDISHNKLTPCLESHRFELIRNTIPLREIELDLTQESNPSYISHYYNDEVSYFPTHGRVINKIILPGVELYLSSLYESNYVKIKKFKYVTIVSVSGLNLKGLPLSKYYIIYHLQNITHNYYKPYATQYSFLPMSSSYSKFGKLHIELNINFSDLGSSVTGSVKSFLCDLTQNAITLANVGKVNKIRIGRLELRFTDFLVDLSYHKTDKKILSAITLDTAGNKKFQFFYRMRNGCFRMIPLSKNVDYINKLYPSLPPYKNIEFDTPLLVDVTAAQASSGIKVTFLPNSSVLYSVNTDSLASGKRPYISAVKIGSYVYKLEPGFAQVGVKVIDKFETLVIIDEKNSESSVFTRTVFSLSNKVNGFLLKSTEIDWDSIVFLKEVTSDFICSRDNEYLLKFIITNFRGTPGVIDKIDINDSTIFYAPAFGSNVIFGDIVYKKVTNYWSKEYIYSLVMTEGTKETKLTVFRFLKNSVKLFIYYINESGEETYSYVRVAKEREDSDFKSLLEFTTDEESESTDDNSSYYLSDVVSRGTSIVEVSDLLDSLLVNLDLRDIDESYFNIDSNNNVRLITAKYFDVEDPKKGYKLKIGDVILPDGQKALNYYSYTKKTVEYAENKITIYIEANHQPINIIYERKDGNGRWYTHNKEDSRTLLAMENILPHHGMQYLTLDFGYDNSKTFVKVTNDFYYCGELIKVRGNYAYALLVHEGQKTTKLYLYHSSNRKSSKAEKYQCTSIAFNKPKFNTKWVDISHVLDKEMANEMSKSSIFFADIPALNLDSPLIPGVTKSTYGTVTVYSCAGIRIGTLIFGNVSLFVNSIFIRVFVVCSEGYRRVLVEYYQDYKFNINLDAFKEIKQNTFEKIDIAELTGTLGEFVKPYLRI